MKQLTVTTHRVTRALSNLETVKKLEPFIKREKTLSEADNELELKLPLLARY